MPRRQFVWDDVDDCVLEETDESGNTLVTYTREPGPYGPLTSEYRNGTTYTHHYDGLGSTQFLTDDSGNVTDTFIYDAWGNEVARTGTTETPYRWCGRWGYQYDQSTGGYYICERNYQPTLARWMSVDPIEYWEYYRYARCSPPNLIDPSGLVNIHDWDVTLINVLWLDDYRPSSFVRWSAKRQLSSLKESKEEVDQFWLLTRTNLVAVIENGGQCITKSKMLTTIDVVPANSTGIRGLVGITDRSGFTGRLDDWGGNACTYVMVVWKLGGINALDPEKRLPPLNNWSNPPEAAVDLIVQNIRDSFSFIYEYNYVDNSVCKKCRDIPCRVDGSTHECVLFPGYDAICDRNYP